jgi:hypothetical protein
MDVLGDKLSDQLTSSADTVDNRPVVCAMPGTDKTSDEFTGTDMSQLNSELCGDDHSSNVNTVALDAAELHIQRKQNDHCSALNNSALSTTFTEASSGVAVEDLITPDNDENICHSESVIRNDAEIDGSCMDLSSHSLSDSDCVNSVLLDLINRVVDKCEERSCSRTGQEESRTDAVQPAALVGVLQASDSALEIPSSNHEETQLISNCELRLSIPSMQRCGQAFQMNNYLPRLVMDLRHPPLVQVCTLYGTTNNGIDAGSSGANSCPATVEAKRPQTAIRGRRRQCSFGSRLSHCADKDGQNEVYDQSTNRSDTHLVSQIWSDAVDSGKTVSDGPTARRSLRNAGKVSDMRTDGESMTNRLRGNKKNRRKSTDSVDSDEDCMMVQTVNRTYARYSYAPHAPVSIHDEEAELDGLFFPETAVDKPKGRIDSTSLASVTKTPVSGPGASKVPARTAQKNRHRTKKRVRIGPAWYSRLFLNSPPARLLHPGRTILLYRAVKRPNYVGGCRRRPLPRHGSLHLTSKKQVHVKSEELSELDNIGGERLTLWRMSSDDMEELQSQLMREAEHRRVEHAMPVVMQLSSDQIETAYQRVAESMKTFDIVAADSDEDEVEQEEDEALEEDNYEEILDEYRRMVAEREHQDELEVSAGTEYTRSRPKRLAVDYGPSAFAPILFMEGRRLSSERPKLKSTTKSTPGHRKSSQFADERTSDSEAPPKKKASHKSPGLTKETQRNIKRRSSGKDPDDNFERFVTNGKR